MNKLFLIDKITKSFRIKIYRLAANNIKIVTMVTKY